MKMEVTNEIYWKNMTPDEQEEFVLMIFQYYRVHGFPYYPTDKVTRDKEFQKLMNYDYHNLVKDVVIGQSMHGLGLAWSYFPHAFNVRSNDKMTPYEAFMDDEIFKKVIRKRLKIGTYMSDSGIRKMLKIYTGVQGVSNFRPTAAACIYDMFAKNGVVWDMSMGWGGRMLGAIAGGVKMYIGTEPSSETFDGLTRLAIDYGAPISTQLYRLGSEDFKPNKDSLDLCFTSPPYFDLEKYADEETQSYMKFDNKEAWVEGFLRPTFENCYYGLKSNKHMIINIADVKGKHNINLEEKTIQIAQEVGFKLVGTRFLALSNINLRYKDNKFKYEPIFIFKKV
jgi:hypothetical protein